jgi:predicted nucleotidyltransferase component of viral defense system
VREVVLERIRSYKARSLDAHRQALREIVQEIALLGLWRAKFFEHAAFYGGTALRILYGLDRFSEDLEFTLVRSDPRFSLGAYGRAVKGELTACGFDVTLQVKERTSAIESAFVKTNTLHHLIRIASALKTHRGEVLSVRLEVDTDPALGFTTEAKQFFWPILFSVTSCDLPSLFAGKLHATGHRRRC